MRQPRARKRARFWGESSSCEAIGRDAGLDRGRGQPLDRCRDVGAARVNAGDQLLERGLVETGAAEIDAEIVGIDPASEVLGVLVEGEEIDLALGEPGLDFAHRVEIESLETQVKPRIAAEARPRGAERGQEVARRLGAAQARLPRESEPVIGGGNAVGEQLPVGLDEGRDGRETHTRAGHQLMLEGVAVEVDDAGKDDEWRFRRPAGFGHRGDAALFDGDLGRPNRAVGEEGAAGEAGEGHRRPLGPRRRP